MQIVDLTDAGAAPYEILRKYGGTYSFFEKLRKGGTGSTKWIYHSGISAFDAIREGRGTDTCYINAEFLKNGILFRLNKVQRLKGLIATFDDIEKTVLEDLEENDQLENTERLSPSKKLSFYFFNGTVLVLKITANTMRSTKQYFAKSPITIEVV